MADPLEDTFEELARATARGALADDAAVEAALRERSALEAPALLERVRAALDRFWKVVHDDPALALGLVTVGFVAASARGANPLLRAELRHRRGTALFALGRAREASRELEAGLTTLAEPAARFQDGADVARARAALLGFLGNARIALGEVPRACVALEEALFIARSQGLKAAEGIYLSSLGNARTVAGEARAAAEYYEQALSIARSVGNERGEAVNLGNLGLAKQALGDLEGALGCYESSHEIAERLGDRRGAATDCANMGAVLHDQGDLAAAEGRYKEAQAAALLLADKKTEAIALLGLAALSRERGEPAEAGNLAAKARTCFASLEDPKGSSDTLAEIARASIDLGEPEAALGHLAQALELSRTVGDRRGEATILFDRGRALLVAQRFSDARRAFEESLGLTREVEDQDGEALIRVYLAETTLAEAATGSHAPSADPKVARTFLDQALARVKARPGSVLAARHALALGAAAKLQDRVEEARRHLERALETARARGFVLVEREAERRLGALPPRPASDDPPSRD